MQTTPETARRPAMLSAGKRAELQEAAAGGFAEDHAGMSARAARLSSMQEKKRQRLVQKAESRPTATVMGKAPAGMMNLAEAPKLMDFRSMAATAKERSDLHAQAMHEWMKKNITKSAIEADTKVRSDTQEIRPDTQSTAMGAE